VLMLFTVALLLYGVVKRANWTYADLGIRRDFIKDIIPYSVFTLVGVVVLFFVSEVAPTLEVKPHYRWWEDLRFLLLFIPISVLQEIVFRGILMRFLRHAFKSPIFIITLNASLFALIHVIYLNSVLIPITFAGGIVFALIYYKYPNLVLVSIAHTILNFTAMILGFFVIR
jgi:membrane protease YdiL (CAAX protease family)